MVHDVHTLRFSNVDIETGLAQRVKIRYTYLQVKSCGRSISGVIPWSTYIYICMYVVVLLYAIQTFKIVLWDADLQSYATVDMSYMVDRYSDTCNGKTDLQRGIPP